jgi:hypothetical protein
VEDKKYCDWIVDAVNELRGDPANVFNGKVSKKVLVDGDLIICNLVSGRTITFLNRDFMRMVSKMSEFYFDKKPSEPSKYSIDNFPGLTDELKEIKR